MSVAIAARPAAAKRPAPRRAAPPRAGPAVRLPVSPRRLRRFALWAGLSALIAVGVVVIFAARLPQRAAEAALAETAAAGLEIRDVHVTGLRHVPRAAVLDAALAGDSSAILAADLNAMRARIEALPWVASATVSRRLPASIEIAVAERAPAALWQHRGRLVLVDATGQRLEPADVRRFAHLPLVVGPDANLELPSLVALLKTKPALAAKVDSAVWVGRRRWDLHMKSGETLALPEGYAAAETALRQFARLHADKPLLGQGYLRFDLRLPGKMVVRLAEQPPAPTKGTAI